VVDCVLLKKVNIKTWQAIVSQKLNENKIEKKKKKKEKKRKKKKKKEKIKNLFKCLFNF